ncbi:MAG: hypothetical protein IT439_05700 [Phycisphaerales bacterium]|nr:hypothetical protein [Phycisphaerales bacterium]
MRAAFGVVLSSGIVAVASMPALSQSDLDQTIRSALSLSDYTLVDLDLPGEPSAPFQVTLPLGGVNQTITLAPWSIRTPGFRVMVDDGFNGLREIEAEAPRTCRGAVLGADGEPMPASVAGGSLLDEGLKVMIVVPGKHGAEHWFVQPLSEVVPGQPMTRHIVYRATDTQPLPYVCGTPDVPGDGHAQHDGDGNGRVEVYKQAQIAIDADFQFFQLNGSSETNTVNDIENVMATVSISYQLDVDITYLITQIIVRTSSGANPYTSNNSSTLLNQFQAHWNANHAGVTRDVAHLFTGREVDGNVIGIAFLGQICNLGSAYGLSQSRFTGAFSLRVALTAHELGHNWNAQHCDSQNPCRIMCSGINACDPVGSPPRFGPTEITQITNFRNTRNCLVDVIVGLVDLPFSDVFPSGSLDATKWATNNGVTITLNGGAPSPSRVAQFDSADSMVSKEIRAGNPGGPVNVSFFQSHLLVEAGESLIVEMTNTVGDWNEIGRVTGDGNVQVPFTQHSFLVPGPLLFDGAELRIRADGNQADDIWQIDNFLMDIAPGYPLPFTHSFDAPSLDTAFWPVVENGSAVVTEDALNEPSAPYSMVINRTTRVESAKLLAAAHAASGFEFSFSMQEKNLEAGDILLISFVNASGTSVPIDTIVSSGGSQTTFTRRSYVLPAAAYHDELQIVFQGIGNQLDDEWYIDDVSIDVPPAPACPADLSGSTDPNDPSYGVPDGNVDSSDFFYFLDQFVAGNLAVADLSGSSDPNDPSYGVPDGTVDSSDFFYFLDIFVQGCP